MKDPQRLEPELDLFTDHGTQMWPREDGGYVAYEDYQALRKVSDDLLEALDEIIDSGELPYCSDDPMVIKGKAAIAKAKGES